jgi:hypothetical protein
VARHTLGAAPAGLPLTVVGYAAARAGNRDLAVQALDQAKAAIPGLGDTAAYRDALTQGTDPEGLRPHYPGT